MELLALHLKRDGSYICRVLSCENCTYDIVRLQQLTDAHKTVYDSTALLLQDICREVLADLKNGNIFNFPLKDQKNEYLGVIPSHHPLFLKDRLDTGKNTILGLLWGAHQRLFRLLCVGVKIDAAFRVACAALDEGRQVVYGIQSTGEATQVTLRDS
jgi:hypothetical protein